MPLLLELDFEVDLLYLAKVDGKLSENVALRTWLPSKARSNVWFCWVLTGNIGGLKRCMREGPEEKTESWSSGTSLKYQVKACVGTLIVRAGLQRAAVLGGRSNCELHNVSALSDAARASRSSGDDR